MISKGDGRFPSRRSSILDVGATCIGKLMLLAASNVQNVVGLSARYCVTGWYGAIGLKLPAYAVG